ncbi:hypothetical protein COLO4_31760 [Corchorus olitorius]|uniref:Uncharacterized protein n=1 Tax=Corchorus olitorius TaxID=93759 RepID=A0A1R3H3G6_9ROSI|nr:hypothetical protein COLO4_31760 [Corchorus olitorius]
MKKTSTVATPAEIIGHNPDLLRQILIRLPTRPLLKFKCVSKQWLSLVSSPDFCHSLTCHHYQTNGYLKPTSLLLRCSYKYKSSSELICVSMKHIIKAPVFDFLYSRDTCVLDGFLVLNSCKGLFLCVCTFISHSHRNMIISKYLVCNPTTKKFKELSFPSQPSFGFNATLAFDPLKSPHYKIIHIWKLSALENKFRLDIYSSETDSWSVFNRCFSMNCNFEACEDSVFWDGKIYWNRRWGKPFYFDMEDKRFGEMQISFPTHVQRIEECQGALNLVAICPAHNRLDLKVFEKPCGSSGWHLKHNVCIAEVGKARPKVFQGYYMPFSLFKDFPVWLFYFYLDSPAQPSTVATTG